jgi:hypothetical protein
VGNGLDNETPRVAASTRLNIGSRKILAFEQESCAMGFRAGVGEAITEIKLGRMSALAISVEAFDRQPTDAFVDGNLVNLGLRNEIVEEVLRGARRNV